MNQYMIDRMQIPARDVPALRQKYFQEYGTTLRGLQANHSVDTQDFLAYVHDVPLSDFIHPDPVQQAVLAALPFAKLIFTNADVHHARRVLQVLQLEQYFVDIIDVNRVEPFCKPNPQAFAIAMDRAGEKDPSRCVMIDDLRHTTRASKDLGLFSILYGSGSAHPDADAVFENWRELPAILEPERP